MSETTEQRLRAALAARAQDAGDPPRDLAARAVTAAGAHRSRTPRPALLVAAAAAVVAVVVLGATAVLGGSAPRRPAQPPATATQALPDATDPATPTYAHPFTPYPFAPRGSLAADSGLVEELRLRTWGTPGGYYGPAPETRQVVFAGAVDGGGTHVFVIGRDGDRWIGTWFAGPDDGSLQAMGDPQPFDPTVPLVWANVVDGVGALVVVGDPGDTARVDRDEVQADGSTVTETVDLPVTDGIGALPVDALPGTGVRVEVVRDGVVVHDGGVDGGAQSGSGAGPTDDEVVAAAVVGARGTPSSDLVLGTLQTLAGARGLAPADLGAAVLWGGRLDGGDAVVVVTAFPSGARQVQLAAGWPPESTGPAGDELSSSGPCGTEVFASQRDLADVVLAAVCTRYSITDGSPLSTQLVVVAPGGTTDVRFLDADGAQLGTAAVDATGAWVGPVPDGLDRVAAVDATGTVVGVDPLLPAR